MFTGIVQEMGVLRDRTPRGPALRFRFHAPKVAHGLSTGDSVACNGVCLTAEEVFTDGFSASAVPETLTRTTLGGLQNGDFLNLESALKAGTPLGGHFVQGHVDGVAEAAEVKDLGQGGRELTVRIPEAFSRYCVEKGSFSLEGVSLTLAKVDGNRLSFALVPHTLSQTTLSRIHPGQKLNFEVDLLGKYVEKLLGHHFVARHLVAHHPAPAPAASDGIATPRALDAASLEKWGYGV